MLQVSQLLLTILISLIGAFSALSLPMANVSGHSRKSTVNAAIFTAYCVAQIIGPQCFRASGAPDYPTGLTAFWALNW